MAAVEAEGVIKYRLDFTPAPALDAALLDDLIAWHARCRALEVVGQNPDRYAGYAYGNLSRRLERGFAVSGTQTGGKPALTPDDYAWALDCDPIRNRVRAQGPVKPSSEALTHGAIYAVDDAIRAVIHGHIPHIWRRAEALGLPVTPANIAYGTPDMAAAVRGIVRRCGASGLLVMGGHEDGVIAYGPDLNAAGERLTSVLRAAIRKSS